MERVFMTKPKKSRFIRVTILAVLLITAGTACALGLPDNKFSAAEYTNTDVLLLLTYVLLALVFSFICSVAEAVLLSITPSYIAGLEEKKPRLSALLRRLKQEDVDHSLAAILTLNTIAHTVGAIGSGAKATIVFGSAWFGLFSAVMTLMILFLSEIIPKTLGAVYWRNLTWATAHFIRGLIVVLYPLIVVSEKLTKLIKRSKDIHIFSRDEFIAMAGIGEKAGQIQEQESRIIRNLFRLGSLKAKDIMTPRTVILGLQEDTTVKDAMDSNAYSSFSRIPLYRKDLDEITGFILKGDILLYKAQDRGDAKLESLKRELMAINGEMPLSELLEFLLDHRQHIALVVSEYGGTKGLVTLEDVVETLLGMEIVDEMDSVEDMQALARQQWEKRAKALGLEVDRPKRDNPLST
jgi:CBS domain containing-hemolysin-like protein